MQKRTCIKCGHTITDAFEKRLCRWCASPFDIQRCHKCHKVGPLEDFKLEPSTHALCIPCYRLGKISGVNTMVRKHNEANIAYMKQHETYGALLGEKDWVKLIVHFRTCAVCQKNEITTSLILNNRKYVVGNVLPICDGCNEIIQHYKMTCMSKQYCVLSAFDKICHISQYIEKDMHKNMKEAIRWVSSKQ